MTDPSMLASNPDQLEVDAWLKENPEVKDDIDRDFLIDRLQASVDRWKEDYAVLNKDLEAKVNQTADNVLQVNGNKNRVLAILAEYNQYLFEYADKAALVQKNMLADERALWELEHTGGIENE